jgi:hypothetical protein
VRNKKVDYFENKMVKNLPPIVIPAKSGIQ